MTTTAIPVCITITCLTCDGAGEVGTRQDYFGNWETETCRTCSGRGDLTVEQAAQFRAERCAHGVHEMEASLCWDCVRERETDADRAEMAAADPWKAATRGGWDAEPPF